MFKIFRIIFLKKEIIFKKNTEWALFWYTTEIMIEKNAFGVSDEYHVNTYVIFGIIIVEV